MCCSVLYCVVASDYLERLAATPYAVATISRLLKITSLFCKRALQKRLFSAKETYNLKEPTNRSHPIVDGMCRTVAVCCGVLQCAAAWCSVVQCSAVWCSLLQRVAE